MRWSVCRLRIFTRTASTSRSTAFTRWETSPGFPSRFTRDGVHAHIAGLDDNTVTRLDVGEAGLANGATKEVESFTWVSDKRLLVDTTVWDMFYGVMATNWDGGHTVPISGYEDEVITINGTRLFAHEVLYRSFDQDQSVLMLDRHEDGPQAWLASRYFEG